MIIFTIIGFILVTVLTIVLSFFAGIVFEQRNNQKYHREEILEAAAASHSAIAKLEKLEEKYGSIALKLKKAKK